MTMSAVARGVLLAFVLASMPGVVRGQVATADSAAYRRTPLELLLEQRGALQLTAGQVARLEVLRQGLAARNEPLIGRIVTLRAQWQEAQGQGVAVRPLRRDAARVQRMRQAVQRAHEQIQLNNRAAMQDVNRLLSREQRMLLRDIVQANRLRRPGAAADTSPAAPRRRDGGV